VRFEPAIAISYVDTVPSVAASLVRLPFESLAEIVKVAMSPGTYDALSNDAVYVAGSPAQTALNVSL